jgi:hypothetical protein
MDSLITEINRINRFPLFSVTEINRSPYGGGYRFGYFNGDTEMAELFYW